MILVCFPWGIAALWVHWVQVEKKWRQHIPPTAYHLNSAVRDYSRVTLLSERRLVNSITHLLTVQRVQSDYIVPFDLVKNIQGHRHWDHNALSPYMFSCFEHFFSSHPVRLMWKLVKYRCGIWRNWTYYLSWKSVSIFFSSLTASLIAQLSSHSTVSSTLVFCLKLELCRNAFPQYVGSFVNPFVWLPKSSDTVWAWIVLKSVV